MGRRPSTWGSTGPAAIRSGGSSRRSCRQPPRRPGLLRRRSPGPQGSRTPNAITSLPHQVQRCLVPRIGRDGPGRGTGARQARSGEGHPARASAASIDRATTGVPASCAGSAGRGSMRAEGLARDARPAAHPWRSPASVACPRRRPRSLHGAGPWFRAPGAPASLSERGPLCAERYRPSMTGAVRSGAPTHHPTARWSGSQPGRSTTR